MVALPLAARRRRRLCLGDRRPLSGHRKRQSAPGQGVDRLGGGRPHRQGRRRRQPAGQGAATCCSRSIPSPTGSRWRRPTRRSPPPGSTSSSCAPPTARPSRRSNRRRARSTIAKSQFDRARRPCQQGHQHQVDARPGHAATSHKAQAATGRGSAGHRRRARPRSAAIPIIATDKHPAVLAALAARDKAAYDLAQTHGPGARRRRGLPGRVLQERPVRDGRHAAVLRWSKPATPGSRRISRKPSSPT